jgi:Spy/CpxP family protein refolding chaperone
MVPFDASRPRLAERMPVQPDGRFGNLSVEPKKINLALLGALVLAGILIGFTASSIAFRYQWIRVPGEGIVRRMDRILKLTPAQHEQVEDTLFETRDKVEQLRSDFRRQRRQLLRRAREQIRASLTPEQQVAFDRNFGTPDDHRRADEGAP